jgi:putative transposase
MEKQAHVVYRCSYHIVWTPNYRYRILEGEVAKQIKERIGSVCEWMGVEILEVNVMRDHVHRVVTIPPRLSISEIMGILKDKTAICIFKGHGELKTRTYWGNHFWSRGYCTTAVGPDEDKIRRCVKYQEDNEKRE